MKELGITFPIKAQLDDSQVAVGFAKLEQQVRAAVKKLETEGRIQMSTAGVGLDPMTQGRVQRMTTEGRYADVRAQIDRKNEERLIDFNVRNQLLAQGVSEADLPRKLQAKRFESMVANLPVAGNTLAGANRAALQLGAVGSLQDYQFEISQNKIEEEKMPSRLAERFEMEDRRRFEQMHEKLADQTGGRRGFRGGLAHAAGLMSKVGGFSNVGFAGRVMGAIADNPMIAAAGASIGAAVWGMAAMGHAFSAGGEQDRIYRSMRFSGGDTGLTLTAARMRQEAEMGESIAGPLKFIPLVGQVITESFKRAADAANQLAASHRELVQANRQVAMTSAGLKGMPYGQIYIQKQIAKEDAKLRWLKGHDAASALRQQGKTGAADELLAQTDATYNRELDVANLQAEVDIERLVGQHNMQTAETRATRGKAYGTMRMIQGDVVGGFAAQLYSREQQLSGRWEQMTAGLRGEELGYAERQRDAEKLEWKAQRRMMMRDFTGNFELGTNISALEAGSVSQIRAVQEEQGKSIETLLESMDQKLGNLENILMSLGLHS